MEADAISTTELLGNTESGAISGTKDYFKQKPCGLEQILDSLIDAYKKRVLNKTKLDE